MSENLWPTDFGQIGKKTPVSILREQAQALGERTANIVLGGVESSATPTGEFRHEFYLRSAALNYLTPLLYITHTIDLYPVDIYTSWTTDKAADTEEFTTRLKALFATDRVKKTIASLIAQSQE